MIKTVSLLLVLVTLSNNLLAMTPQEYEDRQKCNRRGQYACGATLTAAGIGTALFVMFYTTSSGDCDITCSTGRSNCTNSSNLTGVQAPISQTNAVGITAPPSTG